MNSTNQTLKEKLRSVFEQSKLPTNPRIAAEVLNLVNDPDSSADHFADVI